MLFSRCDFFSQNLDVLLNKKKDVITLLKIKGFSDSEIEHYLKAYSFFVVHPKAFDGATLVKDLCDIHGLDLDAMLHDYVYIKGSNRNFKRKFAADMQYLKGMERKGKGVRIGRFIGLCISGLFFVPYKQIF